MSFAAAALHIAVIFGGPDWYRFFGAGETLATAAERGSMMPALITAAIAGLLALWGGFALSGAGCLPRFPLLRTALVAISAIYLARGAFLIPVALYIPYEKSPFDYWSSIIVLGYGVVHATGTWLAWSALKMAGRHDRVPA